jgi:glycopeptide antibiotics resistance protein
MYPGGIDTLPAFCALFVVGLCFVIFKMRNSSTAHLGWILVVTYFAILISVVLFPLPINQTAIDYGRWRTQNGLGPRNNWTLFSTLDNTVGTANFIRQIGGNFLLFAPLGSLLTLVAPRWNLRRILLSIFLTSVMCEITQLATNTAYGFQLRSFDIDDIWLNLLGGCSGLLATKLLITLWPGIETWARRHKAAIIQ